MGSIPFWSDFVGRGAQPNLQGSSLPSFEVVQPATKMGSI